ncbi:nucleotide exchange factor GrpE [Edaphobacillus lindanitolerans]|uniref:Protein GrpE n=1 Tax=Edaphobacillus lindanitolerans TaxID=550447 RepID=A0A1U7PLV1_9BACI|nr:nucleotide exchange factor GrpE [Edaphobacillus lindanitolerans]SIT82458.1 molecular chaperone GrpE [Edaphobacillus lindanitolerans]
MSAEEKKDPNVENLNEEILPEDPAEAVQDPEGREPAETPAEAGAETAGAGPDAERIKELEEALEKSEDKYLRLLSDFENYKRRSAAELQASEKYRSQRLMAELLPVLDNFGRAFAAEVTSEEALALKKGMEMIYQSFRTAMEKEGLVEIEAEGKEFDPNFHHGVMHGEDDSKPSGTVLEELQKGYMLNDRILRPAMVKVNQ